jgi:hypothetical protein
VFWRIPGGTIPGVDTLTFEVTPAAAGGSGGAMSPGKTAPAGPAGKSGNRNF